MEVAAQRTAQMPTISALRRVKPCAITPAAGRHSASRIG
jgi:hypothetical protein